MSYRLITLPKYLNINQLNYTVMNIFSTLKSYAGKWSFKSSREFTPEELACVKEAVVVPSEYGNSCCFHMVAGNDKYIPMDRDSEVPVGTFIDLTKAKLVTLQKDGEADIIRVSI
jgi:hypothetical protein|nr:MAG TPA: hypothetical protein [Crassvirales sp.]